MSADTLSVKRDYKDSFRHKSYPEHTNTVYVRTKVVYRDTAYQRGRALHREEHDSMAVHYQVKIKPGEHIVLNTADTTALKTVPGIGSYFARKVVQYGERLGGYVSVDQLDEIEGFPLDAKEYLVIQEAHPRPLNVNHLSLNELRRLPSIARTTEESTGSSTLQGLPARGDRTTVALCCVLIILIIHNY